MEFKLRLRRYDPESGEARPFRSGYVNVEC